MTIIDTTDPIAVAVAEAIRDGEVAALRRLLASRPELATAQMGGAPDGCGGGAITRSLLHVATDWPGHYPNGSVDRRRAGGSRCRRRRPRQRTALRDAPALGGQQQRCRRARRAAGRRCRHRGRRRRHRRRHCAGRRHRLRAVERGETPRRARRPHHALRRGGARPARAGRCRLRRGGPSPPRGSRQRVLGAPATAGSRRPPNTCWPSEPTSTGSATTASPRWTPPGAARRPRWSSGCARGERDQPPPRADARRRNSKVPRPILERATAFGLEPPEPA